MQGQGTAGGMVGQAVEIVEQIFNVSRSGQPQRQ
jgi:hypothetical protein